MPEQNEKLAWTPGTIRTMNHAQYMVWEMGQSRWPGLPPYHNENIVHVALITREQHEQHGDELPDEWAPHVARFQEDESMTSVRVISMKDGSAAESRQYRHPNGFFYYVWETAGFNCDPDVLGGGTRRIEYEGSIVESTGSGGPAITAVQQW